jgi:hypothetical protein
MSRRLNLPPSYVLIHRVSTAGIGVLCQLECEGPYRAEMIRWMPGYSDADLPSDQRATREATAGELVTDEPATGGLTTAGEHVTGKPAANGLTVNGLKPHGLAANGLSSNGLPAKELTVEELTAGELTAEELTAEKLTAEALTAEEPAAGAAGGPGEPDPVGPAR